MHEHLHAGSQVHQLYELYEFLCRGRRGRGEAVTTVTYRHSVREAAAFKWYSITTVHRRLQLAWSTMFLHPNTGLAGIYNSGATLPHSCKIK